jgi:hypothetical protein
MSVATFILPVLAILFGISDLKAAPPEKRDLRAGDDKAADFVRDIQPIFSRNCYSCHGPEKQQNELRLDVKSAALRGGISGQAISPGDSAGSLLIQYVSGIPEEMRMPQKGNPLTEHEVGLLRSWIDLGAHWPDGLDPEGYIEPPEHWAFRPVKRPPLPRTKRTDWTKNEVDQFILARLEKEGLSPSSEAGKRDLIRRLYFSLTGLPPTPGEIESFLADSSDSAYEALVDRLLASPQYGERLARHWLDVVRFAESHGFETNTERPNAWPYRDYVISAFNSDKPFDQFVLEQLAGDAYGVDAATGFLVGGPFDAVKSPDINLTTQQRMDELHDMINTTSTAFLGLTVGCARCHNHKFDPILQKDYYAMQAIFAGVRHGERELRTPDHEERIRNAEVERRELAQVESQLFAFVPLADPTAWKLPAGSSPLRDSVHPRQNVERFAEVEAKFIRFTILETTGAEPCLDELEVYTVGSNARNVALASEGTHALASGTYPNSDIHRLEHINDGRHGNGRSWISDEQGQGWVQLEFTAPVRINQVVWGRDREEKYKDRLATKYKIEIALTPGEWRLVATSADREPYAPDSEPKPAYSAAGLDAGKAQQLQTLLEQKATHQKRIRELTSSSTVYAGTFEQPGPTHLLHRGEAMQKREQVNPGALLKIGPPLQLEADSAERERRRALARWMVDPQNPLPARVMVNRLWQYHFGRGIVATPSDFGKMGIPPTHPELLDWLAVEFVENGWSIKHVQKRIVMSATFRQSSEPQPEAMRKDAENHLHWRYAPRRIETEPLRDAILAVSGNLDSAMGGPGFDLFAPNSNYVKVYNSKVEFGPAEWRRMIYQSKPRLRLDDTFGAFDCPDGGQVTPARNVSTTPLQALNLLNSPFIMEQADIFAKRLRNEAGIQVSQQIDRAFLLAFGREPSPAEKRAAMEMIQSEGLPIFCRALFNANEFIYIF